jgi:hypothetical protein
LNPQDVPNAETLRATVRRSAGASCGPLLLGGGSWPSNGDAERALASVLLDLPAGESGTAPTLRDDEAIHDAFFSVRRATGDAGQIFFYSVVRSNWLLLHDLERAPFAVDPAVLDRIDAAFAALECRALGLPLLMEPRVAAWRSSTGPRRSMERWIRGHQMFAVLTQGLIVAFREVRLAFERGDDAGVEDAVDFAVLVLRGAGASLEFTGDLPSEDYIDIVRPAMKPPHVPETFSGLFSVDHRRFIAYLRDIAPVLEALGEQYPQAHARLANGLGEVYDGHKFVCERLVGRSPSLMMMSGPREKSGADQIEAFKKRRMRVFETRTTPTPAETAI